MNNNENLGLNSINDVNSNHQYINNQSQINNNMNVNPQYQQENNIMNSQGNQFSSNSNLDLLQFFIGDNYNKITTKPFSFAGAIFGGLYFIYRKMYLVGIVLYILQCFLLYLNLNIYIAISISLIMMILMGIFVNKIYLNYAKKRVNKIILENPGRTQNDLSMICIKKGGKNGVFKVLLIAIITVICTNFVISKFNLKQTNSNQLGIFSFLESDNKKMILIVMIRILLLIVIKKQI